MSVKGKLKEIYEQISNDINSLKFCSNKQSEQIKSQERQIQQLIEKHE